MSESDLIIRQMNRIGELEQENKQLKQENMTLEYISKAFDKKIGELEQKLEAIDNLVKQLESIDAKYYSSETMKLPRRILEVLGESDDSKKQNEKTVS